MTKTALNSHAASQKTASMLAEAENMVAAGRLTEAVRIYEQVILQFPDEPRLLRVLGLSYLEQGRTVEAISHITRSIQLAPSNPTGFRSLGDAYKAAGENEAAVEAYQTALSLLPGEVDVWLNLGTTFYDLGSVDQAMAAFRNALQLSPEDHRVLNNIGKLHQDRAQLNLALEYYDRSIWIKSDYAEARFNRAVALLSLGDFTQGWSEYEWRFKRRNARKVYPHKLNSPRWQGQPLQGRRLLVHCEQGMGDVIQFARFLPMVKRSGGTLILEVQSPLFPLFKSMDCIDRLVSFNASTPQTIPHDFHIPLMSLPAVFKTTLDTIPQSVPYLWPDPPKIDAWSKKLVTTNKVSIGLVWGSSSVNPNRNIDLSRILPWLQIPQVQFYSLQKGDAEAQITSLASPSLMIPLGPHLHDFGDTAAVIANLDMIISVDTAVAHLSAAMGKPTWVLLPYDADWRWPARSERSPWYPAARLFRQKQCGGWDDVVADVGNAIDNVSRVGCQRTPLQACSVRHPRDDHRQSVTRETGSGSPSPSFLKQTAKKRIHRVLLVSPLFGGSLEIIRYLHAGFLQAGVTSRLLDNSTLHQFYNELEHEVSDERNRTVLQHQLLQTLDSRLIACAAEYKPDLVLAVAQSPINNATAEKLRDSGITCAYWFVEDYRFKTYWSTKVTAFDFFFTIQRDDYLNSQFAALSYRNWHYLPLACEPTVHKPWHGNDDEQQTYRCQLGFMGSPYRNRLSVFDKLTHYDVKIWGQGWDDYDLSSALRASVREGNQRITPEESVKIYSSADIVLNLHSSPFIDGINPGGDFVNPRTFEVAACGGFQLIDNRKELAELFDPRNEIAVFHNYEELLDGIDYWLAHPHLRREMSRRAQKRAYRDHSYKQRAEKIIEIIENE